MLPDDFFAMDKGHVIVFSALNMGRLKSFYLF